MTYDSYVMIPTKHSELKLRTFYFQLSTKKMIPLKLELKNFMAYREAEPIDFSGLHTVVLTGDNGAGKSTLLDAITWALWGQARAKRDDELISQNTNEMRVGFVFSEGRDVYQVVRTRKIGKATVKGKAPSSSGSLSFFIRDDNATGGWRQLDETKTSETQAKIIRTLNLTYETFINSAFLKQGRADEFTLKAPGERKALLSEILNLDIWLSYEERVKTRMAAIEREQEKRMQDLSTTVAEMNQLPEHERALGEAQAALRNANEAADKAEVVMAEMGRQRERARGMREQVNQAQTRVRGIDANMARLETDRKTHQQVLAQYESALAQRAEIEQGYIELETGRQTNDALNLKLSSMVELNGRKSKSEHALADVRRTLQSERDSAQRQVEQLHRAAAEDTLQQQLDVCMRQLTQLHQQQEQREMLTQQMKAASEQQGEARAQNQALKAEMNDLKARIDALSTVGAICPTCGRELAEDDRVRILADWTERGKQRAGVYRANETLVKELAAQAAQLEKQMNDTDKVLRGLPALQREASAIEARLAQAHEAAAQLPAALTALSDIEGVLAAEQYGPEARVELTQIMQELAVLGYDAKAHAQLRDVRLPQLQAFVDRKAQLDRAALGVESEQRAIEKLDLQMVGVQQQRAQELQQVQQYQAELAECEKALIGEREASVTLQKAREDMFDAQRKVGAANQRVQACLALKGTRERLEREFEELTRKQSMLEDLRLAFGKNGVPAMIIESVLPELEAQANELLSRMSSGRMNVRFETQRATQSGSVSETLELRINDEIGERAYEMFSGGEAFRINFAVRIALSKLLAHRAGARLQTIFIDEGFGTQDAQGREALVEAINTVNKDFERIIVITHIDELKDAFPARIEIEKTSTGSRARVM